MPRRVGEKEEDDGGGERREDEAKSVPQVSQLFIGWILTVIGVEMSDDTSGSSSVIMVSVSANDGVSSIVISSIFGKDIRCGGVEA